MVPDRKPNALWTHCRVLDGARQAPLSETDYEKVEDAVHAMAAMLVRPRNVWVFTVSRFS